MENLERHALRKERNYEVEDRLFEVIRTLSGRKDITAACANALAAVTEAFFTAQKMQL